MIEVFKTNVKDKGQSTMLVDYIHKVFTNYHVNFDLEDCDKILRVECNTGFVQSSQVIKLLAKFGFYAEVLPDRLPVGTSS